MAWKQCTKSRVNLQSYLQIPSSVNWDQSYSNVSRLWYFHERTRTYVSTWYMRKRRNHHNKIFELPGLHPDLQISIFLLRNQHLKILPWRNVQILCLYNLLKLPYVSFRDIYIDIMQYYWCHKLCTEYRYTFRSSYLN